jgi:hypoxanthine phosphoribosyltransferase
MPKGHDMSRTGMRPEPPPNLRSLVSAADVRVRIDALAAEIARDFEGRVPLFIVIAEGARRFASELQRGVNERGGFVETLIVRARRTRGTDLVEVVVDDFDAGRCTDRDLLVIDDIADEGRTLSAVLSRVRAVSPRTVKCAVLVSKHARRSMPIELDYVGFDVSDGWILGFGMDLDGKYRELDHLAVVADARALHPETRGS